MSDRMSSGFLTRRSKLDRLAGRWRSAQVTEQSILAVTKIPDQHRVEGKDLGGGGPLAEIQKHVWGNKRDGWWWGTSDIINHFLFQVCDKILWVQEVEEDGVGRGICCVCSRHLVHGCFGGKLSRPNTFLPSEADDLFWTFTPNLLWFTNLSDD